MATLSTLAERPPGTPYGSLVAFALDEDVPVLLLSGLAEHTRNLKRDPRASLLVAEDFGNEALAAGRVTLLGVCRPLDDDRSARAAFLAAHPSAARYVDFDDFSFFALQVESVRYVGGFGRMSWIERDAWAAAEPDPLAPHARGIVDHMNDDHADALVAYARALGELPGATSAVMTGIDRHGFDLLVAESGGEERPLRLGFDAPVTTPADARRALVALVRSARERLPSE